MKKDMTVKELAKLVMDHMEFHCMDAEFWLPDPTKSNQIVQHSM